MAPSGGAATVLGVDYQARVVAWLAARALAGQAASSRLGWHPHSEIRSIWVETTDAVDDIRFSTTRDGSAFLQAKHAVQSSSREGSALAKTLHQFAAQGLDTLDRLVLVTSSSSSAAITRDLVHVLDRIRILDTSDPAQVCKTQPETRVYSAVRQNLRREWGMEEGASEEPGKLRRLLSRVFVGVVDVGESEPATIEADQLLRGLLLKPEQSRRAWAQLIKLANQTAILQTGMTAASVARHLAESGLKLGPQLDFRPDIALLRSYSSQVIERLRPFRSVMGDDGKSVQIDREFAYDLQAATDASLLITGDPGAGKSGALAELVELLNFADVVVLSADSLANVTNGELRSELGLEHALREVLANWRSERPAYLVIDAMDAGRGSRAQQALLELIDGVTQMGSRWKVVASVRRFDLRYNPLLKELFPLAGSEIDDRYKLAEFARVRHFNIGALTTNELAQLDDRAPLLGERVHQATPALRELLSSPFNLRLFAELASRGGRTERATPITSRLELLGAYWERRVLDTPVGSYRRESVLRLMSEDMIARGALTVDGATFDRESDPEVVADLLRSGLLVEERNGPFGESRLLAFAHHVLFDYVVARLFFAGRDLQAEIASNPTSLFLVRPSYQLYFEGLWRSQTDRRDFWSLAMRIAASADVPEIAKVIAPAVAAALIANDEDVAVLLESLDGDDPVAANVLQHLVNALLTDEAGDAISIENELVWATFTESISQRLDVSRGVVVRNMVRELTAGGGTRDMAATDAVSVASRRLLRWTWTDRRVDRFFTHFAITGVMSTYSADPAGSAEIVHTMIEPEHLAQFGYVEMPTLADAVPTLLPHNPDLVREIYVAAFGHDEESTAPTELTRGILNMTSNRRQDYNHSLYALAGHFALFLDAFPEVAIEALCFVYGRYASRYAYRKQIAEVDWLGEQLSFVDDYTLFEGTHRSSDEEAKMLDSFTEWVRSAGRAPDEQRERLLIAVQTLRSQVAPAGLWRALLSNFPVTADLQIVAPILQSAEALASHGLTKAIGDLVRTRFSSLDEGQRLEIENAIMRLDSTEGRTSRIRARLIGLIPESSLQTDAARELWKDASRDQTTNGDLSNLNEEQESGFDTDDLFSRYGIDTNVEANATLISATESVQTFNDRHLNEVPAADVTREIWPQMRKAWSHLENPEVKRDASRTLVLWTNGYLARAIDVITRSEVGEAMSRDEIDRLIELIVDLMRERADDPEDIDKFDAGSVRTFDLPVWLVQSSIALIGQEHDDGRLQELVEAAAIDESPSVRLSVAREIWSLRDVRPDLVEAVLERMEAHEQSSAVLARLASSIAAVEWTRPEQLVQRLRNLHSRATAFGARGDGAREACSEIVTTLFIRTGTESARVFVLDLIEQTTGTAADLKGVADNFRNAFAAFGPDRDPLRDRAFELAVPVVTRASSQFLAVRNRRSTNEGDREDSEKVAKDLAQLIESISNDVYFSSGAYERPGENPEVDPTPPIADYYKSARDLLLVLPEVPFPSVIHHVLETLEHLSPAKPGQVFRDMTEVILRGRAGGYEYDQMAANFVAGCVSRFLVQHRQLLQAEPELRSCLINVLDTFVAVGWGEARKLTYALDTVFR